MNKLANVKSGELYAIPLFITEYQDSKSFSKEKFEEPDKQFVFCRIIEDLGGGILIEVFNKIGSLSADIHDITLVAGVEDNLSLWKGGNSMGQISENESKNYETWIVWRSSQVEKRVLKCLFN
jgi:hypothetical protein